MSASRPRPASPNAASSIFARPRRNSPRARSGTMPMPSPTGLRRGLSRAPRPIACSRARHGHGRARSIRPMTAAPNRNWRHRRLPKRRADAARGSSPIAPCAELRKRRDGFPASSPRRARSPASPCVLAGGAWSRRFCANAGIDLPQLTVINSVQRTEPIETRLEHSCSAGKFAIRKRLDGGYTIAHRHLSVADIVPDSFPLFFDFLPALRLDWKGLAVALRPALLRRGTTQAQMAAR